MNIGEIGECYNNGHIGAWAQTGPFRYELLVSVEHPVVVVLAKDEITLTAGGTASDEVAVDVGWDLLTKTAIGVHVENCISSKTPVGYGYGEPYHIDIKNGDYLISGPHGSLVLPTYDTQNRDLWEWVHADWVFGDTAGSRAADVFFQQHTSYTAMHFGSDLKRQLMAQARNREKVEA